MQDKLHLDCKNGNEDWSGACALAADHGCDGPLRSLAELVPRLKALRHELWCPYPIVVILARGVYSLAETLMWNDAALSYATVRAAEGAEVIIRGARRPRARFPKFDVEAKDWNTFKIDAVHCP